MSVSDWIILCLGFLSGIAIGVFYFGGIWFTVQNMTKVKSPRLWVLSSFVLRAVIVLAAFYGMLQYRWEFLAVALAGFMIARFYLVRKWGLSSVKTHPIQQESHGN